MEKIISSGLEADPFGKTHMAAELWREGVLADFSGGGAKFAPWRFSGTEVAEDGKVWLTGEIFPSARNLSEILFGDDEEKSRRAAEIFVRFMGELIDGKIDANPEISKSEETVEIGGGGILIDGEFEKVLMLPPKIAEQCHRNISGGDGKDYSEAHGLYVYKGLNGRQSLIFTRAAVAYRAISGRFPYMSEDLSERQTDIFDRNFVPLSYEVNGIDQGLSDAIDAGLSLRARFSGISGERRYRKEKSERLLDEIEHLAETFDTEKFIDEIENGENGRKNELTEPEFSRRKEKFRKSKERSVRILRFFRRNRTRIAVGLAAFAVALWGIWGYAEADGRKACTRGLSSLESARVFYSLVHRADAVNLDHVSRKREMKDFLDTISGFYVMIREREAYSASDRTVAPEEWFFYRPESNYWLFGITNLKIDGREEPSEVEIPRKGERRRPILQEGGKALRKGDTAEHEAEYFFVHTDSARVNAQKVRERITLEWDGKMWLVKKLEGIPGGEKQRSVGFSKFREEFKREAELSGNSVRAASRTLRESHGWIPREDDMERAAEILLEKYRSKAAEAFLNDKN